MALFNFMHCMSDQEKITSHIIRLSSSFFPAILVCVAFLAILIAGIVIIAIRSRRKHGTFSPQGDDSKDEEEGLLYPAPTSSLDGTEVDEMPTAKLRQGPKSKRTPSAEAFDEENEGKVHVRGT